MNEKSLSGRNDSPSEEMVRDPGSLVLDFTDSDSRDSGDSDRRPRHVPVDDMDEDNAIDLAREQASCSSPKQIKSKLGSHLGAGSLRS